MRPVLSDYLSVSYDYNVSKVIDNTAQTSKKGKRSASIYIYKMTFLAFFFVELGIVFTEWSMYTLLVFVIIIQNPLPHSKMDFNPELETKLSDTYSVIRQIAQCRLKDFNYFIFSEEQYAFSTN